MNAAFSSTQRHMRVPNDGQRTQRPRAERTDPSCRVRLSNTARPASPLNTRLWPQILRRDQFLRTAACPVPERTLTMATLAIDSRQLDVSSVVMRWMSRDSVTRQLSDLAC